MGDAPVQIAPCDGTVTASLPYPGGADISVAVAGEQPIALKAKVRDLLIVGMGDSFASGEGNPDMPAEFSKFSATIIFIPGARIMMPAAPPYGLMNSATARYTAINCAPPCRSPLRKSPVGGDLFGLRLFRRRH